MFIIFSTIECTDQSSSIAITAFDDEALYFTGASSSTNIGLNVKTPMFVGGVSEDYELPEALGDLTGLMGCVSKVSSANTVKLY